MNASPIPFLASGLILLGLLAWYAWRSRRRESRLSTLVVERLSRGESPAQVFSALAAEGVDPQEAADLVRRVILRAGERAEAADAAAMLEKGASAGEARIRLAAAGVDPTEAAFVARGAAFRRWCRRRPVVSAVLGLTLPALGVGVFALGLALAEWNRTGWLVTYPFVGDLAALFACALFALGGVLLAGRFLATAADAPFDARRWAASLGAVPVGPQDPGMTELQWLACHDPRVMLSFLLRHPAYSARKVRLFAVGCHRLVSEFHADDPRLDAEIEAVERFAEGLIGMDELRAASPPRPLSPTSPDAAAPLYPASPEADYALQAAALAAGLARTGGPRGAENAWPPGAAESRQADLLRDLFNNPFHPVPVDPSWLSWNDGAIPKLAHAIHEGRRYGDLPALADALEQAGCTNVAILTHCRSRSAHQRGCWVVDLILNLA